MSNESQEWLKRLLSEQGVGEDPTFTGSASDPETLCREYLAKGQHEQAARISRRITDNAARAKASDEVWAAVLATAKFAVLKRVMDTYQLFSLRESELTPLLDRFTKGRSWGDAIEVLLLRGPGYWDKEIAVLLQTLSEEAVKLQAQILAAQSNGEEEAEEIAKLQYSRVEDAAKKLGLLKQNGTLPSNSSFQGGSRHQDNRGQRPRDHKGGRRN